ncbi:MAG: DUF523 domain-containing protein [Desulfovibrionaceae bacterium]
MSRLWLVSACLAGVACRYDGTAVPCDAVRELVRQGRALPVCPEQLGGLPTPRPPAELVGDRVRTRQGQDVTEAFARGAEEALRLALDAGCVGAVLKARSPSCGRGRVYDGTFSGVLRPGHGLFAALLLAHGFIVHTEEDVALPDT